MSITQSTAGACSFLSLVENFENSKFHSRGCKQWENPSASYFIGIPVSRIPETTIQQYALVWPIGLL
jgi:hypothetical protein